MSTLKPTSFFRKPKPKLDPNIQFIKAPAFWDIWIMRGLIGLGIVSLVYFLQWFSSTDNIGYLPLYLLLAVAIGFKILKVVHEWYHYFGLSTPIRPVQKRDYTVDMLTTFCAGEPYEMIVDTLRAMVAVKHPHTTYLCDEANDPYLKKVCAELGVVHVYRGTDKTDAKAGNINYALRTHATGEITVILDPDHRPSPDFLERVLPYFNKPRIGYVQCVQAYKNRNESFIAKGAAQQTYHFYGPMMMSMNTYGTVQAIGANCTFRRTALDEIGGHSAGLSEDMHTSMQLHAKKWKSIYVPEALTRGLVPATLSGYYKQQLKWSRGTFELLFKVFPRLAFKFSFRQFIHYLTLPLYFLAGLVTFIDLAVPIAALLMAQAPWRVDINELIQHTLPLLTAVTLVRQFAQKWLLEEHERGFHLLGGALLVGTWWVFLVGLIYTIFRVKVPYIPTPKGDELSNEWKISIPNMLAVLLSILAIVIGLQLDWSPYSWIMATYALVNVGMLGFVILISQQKLLMRIYRALYGGSLTRARRKWYRFRHRGLYPVLRNAYVAFVAVVGIGAISVTSIKPEPKIDLAKWSAPASVVPTLWMTDAPAPPVADATTWAAFEWGAPPPPHKDLNLVSFQYKVPLDGEPGIRLQTAPLAAAWTQGKVPFMWVEFPAPDSTGWTNEDIARLRNGEWKAALEQFGRDLAALPTAVYMLPNISPAPSLAPEVYQAAWKYIIDQISKPGVNNIAWVWAGKDERYLPYGQAAARWMPMNDAVQALAAHQAQTDSAAPPSIPLILGAHPDSPLITRAAQQALVNKFRPTDQVVGVLHNRTPVLLAAGPPVLDRAEDVIAPARSDIFKARQINSIASQPDFTLAAGEAFSAVKTPDLIRGVVYNPTHDWRDGYHPLTRKKLLNDFTAIQNMGANTIRRYYPSIYDHNLLQVAEEVGLRVWYGFWLDPSIDYFADTAAVKAQEQKILRHVAKLKNTSPILAWNLGHETWTHLATHFPRLYLPQVRIAYLQSLDRIAQQIHAIDSLRPVAIALRDHDQLEAVVRAHRKMAPAVDLFGINSFYAADIARLDTLMREVLPDRPYLLSEFGPGGYWDYAQTPRDAQGLWIEPSDFEKAEMLRETWEVHLKGKPGQHRGGFAFCWQDRLEGTATWYGLTDNQGRKKAAYYSLKKAWVGGDVIFALHDAYLVPPLEIPGFRPYLPFWAVSEANTLDWVDYEWWIMRQDDLGGAGRVRVKKNTRRGDVMLPLPLGTYRVYVRIFDEYGHAVTASHGFTVTEEILNRPQVLP